MTVETAKGTITAEEKTLNELVLALNMAANQCKKATLMVQATNYQRMAQQIYDALDEKGYYNGIR